MSLFRRADPAEAPIAPAGAAEAALYGASAAVASSEVRATEPRHFQWEFRGNPWRLLLVAGSLVAKQYLALALICLQVFYLSGKASNTYLMSCNPLTIGWTAAYWCEYSKACVRCFPLMAMVISLVVAARVILTQRSFYVLLQRGVLVDLENFDPLRDPLFWIIMWSMATAGLHFVLDVWMRSGLIIHDGEFNLSIDVRSFTDRGIIVYYAAPVMFFVAFLYQSYDIEEMLLPLSKYWEEDPEWARASSAKMVCADERLVAKAVMLEGLQLELPGASAAGEEVSVGPGHFAREIMKRQAKEKAAVEAGTEDKVGDFQLSRWRHISKMWTAQLLLDPQLQGPEHRRFRLMMALFSVVSLGGMAFVFFFFGYQIYKDVLDITTPPYQRTDIMSLLVELLYLLFTAGIAHAFWSNTLKYWF